MLSRIILSATFLLPLSTFADPSGTVSNDGEIAQVLVTLSEGEVDAGNIELKHGKNADVKAFAKSMVDDHKSNMKQTKEIAKANSLHIKDSDLSKSLTTDAKSNNADLKKADKAAFDLAYVKQQITMHEGALKVIDGSLLPKVQNANLRAHLEATRKTVEAHLDHAKTLLSKM